MLRSVQWFIPYRRFVTGSNLKGQEGIFTFEDKTGYPKTSVWNNHFPLRNIPEERGLHSHPGGSLVSHFWKSVFVL
jgi:hypothetical protein